MDDAAGRPLPARVPRSAGEGRFVPRPVLQSRSRRGSDAAADPAVRLRCGDPVFRHPGGSPCAGPAGVVCRRRRAAACAGRLDRDGLEMRLLARSISERFAPVFETIRIVRAKLPREVALLGFCGAPWTVATYMVAGCGTPDQAPARLFAYRDAGCLRQADRYPDRSLDRLPRRPARSRRRCGAALRHLGRRARDPTNSSAGASNRRSGSSQGLRQRVPGAKDHRISARRRHVA